MKFHRPLCFFTFLGLGLAACHESASAPCPQGPGLQRTAFNGTELDAKVVSLTFNGGPSEFTGEISDYLYAQDIRATFFVTGKQAAANPKRLAQLHARRHLVGNFGYSGKNLRDSADPLADMKKTDQLISDYVLGNIFLFRAPENSWADDFIETVNLAGLRKYAGPIGWDIGTSVKNPDIPATVDPEDPAAVVDFLVDTDCWAQKISVAMCAQGYMSKIRDEGQGIVVLNDTSVDTLNLVKTLVTSLKNESFSFVRLDNVPLIRLALEQSGAHPDADSGAPTCHDYTD